MSIEKLIYISTFTILMAVLSPFVTAFLVGGGMLAGLVAGWLLPNTWEVLQAWSGLDLPLWQVGGFLGFFGAFFRPSVNLQRADD